MPERRAPALPLFVGRAQELEAVHAVVERAAGGEASALLVSGDAGVGKSTLVQQALAEPWRSDVVVLSGGGLPLGSMSVPFLALRAALRGVPAHLPAPPSVDSGDAASGAPVLVDQWLDAVCALRPVVLVVDASRAGRSVAALVHGFATFDPRVRLGGVILNRIGSDRHEELCREALAGYPVLGAIRPASSRAASDGSLETSTLAATTGTSGSCSMNSAYTSGPKSNSWLPMETAS